MARKKVTKKAKKTAKKKTRKAAKKTLRAKTRTKAKAKAKKVEKAVRNWSRPLPLTEVKKLKQKGVKTIVSSSGFTEGAIKYAKRARISLYHNRKKVV